MGPLLVMKNIVKRFPGILALNKVNFDLFEGEVHALLGENGAGKTTLMNILYGLYRMDEGEIFYRGEKVKIHSPSQALALGIGMVQQHFTLIPSFTVAENVMLSTRRFERNINDVIDRIRKISEEYELRIDPNARIWQMSVGERQRVEILKLLYTNAKVVILDEPTAVLTPQETKALFRAIRLMIKNGAGVVFISHKLKEVMEISDRVTVLKNGEIVGTLKKGEYSEKKLARMMVGRNVVFQIVRKPANPGREVLRVEDVRALNDKGFTALNGINLKVREGEILGVAGVAGNGQRELAEVITGLREVSSGRIIFYDEDITRESVSKRISLGISYIPQDRKEIATCPNLSVAENLFLKDKKRVFWFDRRKILDTVKTLIEKYSIITPDPLKPVKLLSGGNIQKVVVAREFELHPKLIIAEHPTRGLDVASMEFVYRSLLEARDRGVAILLLAGDLDEIFTLSDRVVVIYEGRIVGEVEPDPSNLEKIGLMMAGVVNV
ncbi:MAG: ABC transporter ATP-binding protein [Thermotogaceae bacterium]|nr:ABC transporter ATP-binding protein [Thermotogaceae bacterium]